MKIYYTLKLRRLPQSRIRSPAPSRREPFEWGAANEGLLLFRLSLHRLRGPPPSSEGGEGRSPLTKTNYRTTPFSPTMRLRSHARVILSGAQR